MNWSVDTPRRVDDHVVAAIVETRVSLHAAGRVLTGFVRKRPLMILHLGRNDVTGTDLAGRSYDAEEIELLYPDAIMQLRSQLERTV